MPSAPIVVATGIALEGPWVSAEVAVMNRAPQTQFAPARITDGRDDSASLRRSVEIRPGLFRATTANLLDVETVALRERHGHAGFNLRSKSGKNGERGGDEGGNGHRGKRLDHDCPLSWAFGPVVSLPDLVTKAGFGTSSPKRKMVSSRPGFVSCRWTGRNIATHQKDAPGPQVVHWPR